VRGGSLPTLTYSVEIERFPSLIDTVQARGESVVEVGRLVMLPEVRSDAAKRSVCLANRLIAAAAAQVSFVAPVENVLINCWHRHRVFYAPFGFRSIGEARLGDTVKTVLHGRPEWAFPATRARCLTLADELVTTGQAILATWAPDPELAIEEVSAWFCSGMSSRVGMAA
jgi:hypothetical protein